MVYIYPVTEFLLGDPFPQSAVLAAAARAAHLLVDARPHVFADTLAARLLGPDGETPISYHLAQPDLPFLRAVRVEASARARFAEDALLASGVRQHVVVGAGLDTFAYRQPGAGIHVFEVDRPAAQERKIAALHRANLDGPVSFVGADLAQTPLAEALRAAGADEAEPIFVAALGLAMYLTPDELAALLRSAASWAGGALLVLDHLVPPVDEMAETYSTGVGGAVAAGGEPWRSRHSASEAAALARAAGFTDVRTTTQRDAFPALWERADGLEPGSTSGFLQAATASLESRLARRG